MNGYEATREAIIGTFIRRDSWTPGWYQHVRNDNGCWSLIFLGETPKENDVSMDPDDIVADDWSSFTQEEMTARLESDRAAFHRHMQSCRNAE